MGQMAPGFSRNSMAPGHVLQTFLRSPGLVGPQQTSSVMPEAMFFFLSQTILSPVPDPTYPFR